MESPIIGTLSTRVMLIYCAHQYQNTCAVAHACNGHIGEPYLGYELLAVVSKVAFNSLDQEGFLFGGSDRRVFFNFSPRRRGFAHADGDRGCSAPNGG